MAVAPPGKETYMFKLFCDGYIFNTPETMETNGDFVGVKFTVHAKLPYTGKKSLTADGKRKSAFINCCAFGRLAEYVVAYAEKGMHVSMCGSPTIYTYEKDGQTRIGYNMNVDEISIARGVEEGGIVSDGRSGQSDMCGFEDIESGDIPF